MRIRYYGNCGQMSGYAHAANELCLALLGAGAELEIRVIGKDPAFDGPLLPLASRVRSDADLTPRPDVVIIHTTPKDAGIMLDGLEADGQRMAPLRVAYTTWEAVSPVTDEVHGWLEEFDQVWVPSTQNLACFRGDSPWQSVPAPFHAMPHSFDEASFAERRGSRPSHRSDGPFRFYYVGAWTGRKNPAGILRAWARAFDPQDPVSLHIHSTGTEQAAFVIAAHSTGLRQADMAKVTFTSHELSESGMRAMHQKGDCFVTASRAEAWNLPAFDAMLAGRMVITTRGLGSDEFLSETDAVFVPGIPQPVQDDVTIGEPEPGAPPGYGRLIFTGSAGVTSKSSWMEPNLVALADAMRHVALGRLDSITAFYDPAKKFGRKVIGDRAMTLLRSGL